MSFEVRINGQTVWKTERQVEKIAMQSGRGEIGAAGIAPTDGVIDVLVTEVPTGGPLRLDQVENAARQANRERLEGTDLGAVRSENYNPPEDANKLVQGEHTYQVDNDRPEPGGPVDADGNIRHPSIDDGPTEEEIAFHKANGNLPEDGEEETPEDEVAADSGNGNLGGGFQL